MLTPDVRSSSMVVMAITASTHLSRRARAAALHTTLTLCALAASLWSVLFSPDRRRIATRLSLLALIAALLPALSLPGPGATAVAALPAASATWVTPVPAMEIVTAFDPRRRPGWPGIGASTSARCRTNRCAHPRQERFGSEVRWRGPTR